MFVMEQSGDGSHPETHWKAVITWVILIQKLLTVELFGTFS